MRPPPWHPPVALSPPEQAVYTRIKYAKLFRFLRDQRLTLFSDEFQAEFAVLYTESPLGQPPAQLALARILQAYTSLSDDAVIEALLMDRRRQLVRDCLNCATAPFSKGTLVIFRNALLAHHLDRRLLERTLEIAQSSGAFSPRALRAALDSSPLAGAGRVDDTYNLLGHAVRNTFAVLAARQGRARAAVTQEAGATLIAGAGLHATLGCNLDDPTQREAALRQILYMFEQGAAYMAVQAPGDPALTRGQGAAAQVRTQDGVLGPMGEPVLRQGVAADRRISMEDREMRQERKSQSVPIDGYKRHVPSDLATDLIVAVGVRQVLVRRIVPGPDGRGLVGGSRQVRGWWAWMVGLYAASSVPAAARAPA